MDTARRYPRCPGKLTATPDSTATGIPQSVACSLPRPSVGSRCQTVRGGHADQPHLDRLRLDQPGSGIRSEQRIFTRLVGEPVSSSGVERGSQLWLVAEPGEVNRLAGCRQGAR